MKGIGTSESFASTDPRELWKKADKEFRGMSDAQKVQTLVAAGLFTRNLKPAPPFRGLFRSGQVKR